MKITKLKPPFGWVGGKSRLAKDIVVLIPTHSAILIEDEVFIKKIEQSNDEYILKSINFQYQDIKTKELKIIGKVIGVLTKL